MKVLVLTNLYPNRAEPERGVFIEQLVSKFGNDCNATIVSPLPWVPKFRRILRRTKWASFGCVPLSSYRDNIWVYYPKYFLVPKISNTIHAISMFTRLVPFLRKLHKRNRFDIIVAFWAYPDGVAAAGIARMLGLPLVISGRGCDINRDTQRFFLRKQISWALRRSDRVIVVSEAMREKVLSLGIKAKRIYVIGNGVDETLFTPIDRDESRLALGLPFNDKIVLFVGQLVPVKGLVHLLNAFRNLFNHTNENIRLIIIGEGPLKESLLTLAKQLGIEEFVDILGQKRHSELPRWMSAANVLCLPSLSEGCPNVIIEAISCGIPVVASNVGAIPELLAGGKCGCITNPGDSKNLARALQTALEKKWEPYQIRGAITGYSWEAKAKRYIEEFHNVLKEWAEVH